MVSQLMTPWSTPWWLSSTCEKDRLGVKECKLRQTFVFLGSLLFMGKCPSLHDFLLKVTLYLYTTNIDRFKIWNISHFVTEKRNAFSCVIRRRTSTLLVFASFENFKLITLGRVSFFCHHFAIFLTKKWNNVINCSCYSRQNWRNRH